MDLAQPSEFGALLKRHRRAACLSQEALAERADLSARVVSDIERGVIQAPQRDTVTRLADALTLPAPRPARHPRPRKARARHGAAWFARPTVPRAPDDQSARAAHAAGRA